VNSANWEISGEIVAGFHPDIFLKIRENSVLSADELCRFRRTHIVVPNNIWTKMSLALKGRQPIDRGESVRPQPRVGWHEFIFLQAL
jgi:hypothetical protein